MRTSTLALFATLLLAAPALAQQYTCHVGGATFNGNINANVTFNGNMKGNYVQTPASGDTRTITGLSGGGSTAAPRNDTITPLTGNVTGNGNTSTVPTGSLFIRWNGFSHTVELFNLTVDMNGTSPDPAVPVTANLTYPGFRAVVGSATYTYISVGAIPIPLGNATLTSSIITQTGRGSATATAGTGGAWTFMMDVPVSLDAVVNSVAGDTPVAAPITLHVTGTLNPGPTSCSATLNFSINQVQTVNPVPGDPANPLVYALAPPPFPLAPAGATANANVLMVLSVTGGTVTLTGNTVAPTTGGATSLADVGRQGGIEGPDGLRDNNDFIVFINRFFGPDPLADIGKQGGHPGGDGLYDNNDFVVFIDAFFTP